MEFKEYKLSDLTINGKGEYGIGASAVEYNPSLYRYLRITDIDDNGFINTDELKSVNDKNAENYLLKENEIVFARTGNSTGKSYFYNEEDGPLVFAGFLIRFKLDSKKVNPKFIRYYTLSENYKGWINQFATGSTRKNINAKTYGNMIIKLPPRSYQNYIVQILDSLEEKLKENKKIIANLEELSQTLFKRWFVDFEFPDENGNPYKSSGGEMIDSELGTVPKGWKILELGKITEIIMGQSPKSDTYNTQNEGLPLLNGATDFKNRILNATKYTTDPKKRGQIGDYVFGVRATVGLVTELDRDYAIGRGAAVARVESTHKEWLYEILVKSFQYFENSISGSVYINISSNDLNNYKVIYPSTEIMYKYHDKLVSIFDLVKSVKLETNLLTLLRDTLLPKLMSGEIEIPNDIEVNEDELSI